MTRSGPWAATLLALWGVLTACAHLMPSETVASPPRSATGLVDHDLGTQRLMRARYQGPRGSGALRLVLLIQDRDRYRVETRDRFGRGLWTLEARPGEVLLLDERRALACRSQGEIRIPEIALESLPLGELPAILLGRLPADLRLAGDSEYRDSSGRRWTVTGPAAEPEGWTVWERGEPWLWWGRDPEGGGVLSHRAGSQLRWKTVAAETLSGPLASRDLDKTFREVDCAVWSGEEGGP